MYFCGSLEIDPTQSTLIKKVKTNTFFSKFVDALTFGAVTSKQEHETFTAISILQQIYMGLRSIKIENIIRLSVDDFDFYLDDKGEENDLDKAIFEFSERVDPIDSELFNSIYLVMEHLHGKIKYLIEIMINRKHKVGEYPIVIYVNGVLNDFKLDKSDSKEKLMTKMDNFFSSKKGYTSFVNNQKVEFDNFIDELAQAVKKFIKVDDVRKTSEITIIRPSKKIDKVTEVRHQRFAHPVYYGYFGFDNFFFYTWFWAEKMYAFNVYCNMFEIVDEIGNPVMKIGEKGFNAGEANTLNPSAPLEAPPTDDVVYYPRNEYHDELKGHDLIDNNGEEVEKNEVYTEWLDPEKN